MNTNATQVIRTKRTRTVDPLPYVCLSGEHRAPADASFLDATSGPMFTHSDHKWTYCPRSSAELVLLGYGAYTDVLADGQVA